MKTPKKMTMDEIRAGVQKAIEQSVADKYNAFVEHLEEVWMDRAEGVLKEGKGMTWYDLIHGKDGRQNRFHVAYFSQIRGQIEPMVNTTPQGIIESLKSTARQSAHRLAVQQADQARAQFISKNTMKLENIIYNKSLYGVEGVEVTPLVGGTRKGVFEGRISLVFSDGTEFIVNSQLVYKINAYGTHFYQYPTTFHDVVMPGQKARAMVPEDEMLELVDPEHKGKRIPKEVEIAQEEKKKRADDRLAKREEKRQKMLLRFTYEAVDPSGDVHRSDPTTRELKFALAQRQKTDSPTGWGPWVVYSSGGWFTELKKAEAEVKKYMQQPEMNVGHQGYLTPDMVETAIIPARKLPHPQFVGEVGERVAELVQIERSRKMMPRHVQYHGLTETPFWNFGRDGNNNQYKWFGAEQLTVGAVYEIEGTVDEREYGDKHDAINKLSDVKVVRKVTK